MQESTKRGEEEEEEEEEEERPTVYDRERRRLIGVAVPI